MWVGVDVGVGVGASDMLLPLYDSSGAAEVRVGARCTVLVAGQKIIPRRLDASKQEVQLADRGQCCCAAVVLFFS